MCFRSSVQSISVDLHSIFWGYVQQISGAGLQGETRQIPDAIATSCQGCMR